MIKTKEEIKSLFSTPENSIKYADDFGCGFSFALFENKIKKEDVFYYFNLLANGYSYAFSHYDYSFFKKHLLGDCFNSPNDQFLITEYYMRFRKIFGGNHFCEYGKTDDNKFYLLIHCGSDNLFKKIYERTKDFKFSVSKATNYAVLNRKEILKNFCYFTKSEAKETLDEIHHFVNFEENFVVHNHSISNKNGNIYACGPWETSYHLLPPENVYLEHGPNNYYYPLFDFKTFLNKKNYINTLGYNKKYKKEIPNLKIIRKLYPEYIVRANRDC